MSLRDKPEPRFRLHNVSHSLSTTHHTPPYTKTGQRATSRELFYHVKTQQAAFRVKADADSAVLDAASLLGVPRHQLGIVGAAKGLLAGRFRFRVRFFEPGPDGQQQGGQQQGPAVAVEAWQDCTTGTLVDSDWVGHSLNKRRRRRRSRCCHHPHLNPHTMLHFHR